MIFEEKQCKFLARLRQKYAGNEEAYDTLMYLVLHDSPHAGGGDIRARVKRALAFCGTPEGEQLYQQVCDVARHTGASDGKTKDDDTTSSVASIYEYSHELAKAAKHRDGILSLNPGVVRPEDVAKQALSKFSKTI